VGDLAGDTARDWPKGGTMTMNDEQLNQLFAPLFADARESLQLFEAKPLLAEAR
jgi:hypothetical protein